MFCYLNQNHGCNKYGHREQKTDADYAHICNLGRRHFTFMIISLWQKIEVLPKAHKSMVVVHDPAGYI